MMYRRRAALTTTTYDIQWSVSHAHSAAETGRALGEERGILGHVRNIRVRAIYMHVCASPTLDIRQVNRQTTQRAVRPHNHETTHTACLHADVGRSLNVLNALQICEVRSTNPASKDDRTSVSWIEERTACLESLYRLPPTKCVKCASIHALRFV